MVPTSKKASDKWTTVSLVSGLVLLLVAVSLVCPYRAYAAVQDVVGEVVTVSDGDNGSLEFEIWKTAGSSDDGHGKVILTNGKGWTGESLDVGSIDVEGAGGKTVYDVTAVGPNAFQGNNSIMRVSFANDLTGIPNGSGGTIQCGIGRYSFEGCNNLEEVHLPHRINCIDEYAFANCLYLSTVDFPDNAEIYYNAGFVREPAICRYAFSHCASLKQIIVPAITSATRKNDAYTTYIEGQTYFLSGYIGYWHDNDGPVKNPGMSADAFNKCTSLETVVFRAGNPTGCFAYIFRPGEGNEVFAGCKNLKSISFEGEQPYYYNPNKGLWNAEYRNPWDPEWCTSGIPDLYYGVAYYPTIDDAEADNEWQSSRLCRTDYKRGTEVSDIARGDAAALAGQMLARGIYAENATDGIVPDPNEEAAKAGLDTTHNWVWHLDSTQSRRSGLSESCAAYLVPESDLSFGRIESPETDTLYKLSDQNLSQNPFKNDDVMKGQDVSFDPIRYYVQKAFAVGAMDVYRFDEEHTGENAWFSLTSSTKASFFDKIKIYAADGTEISWDDCEATFQKFDAATNSLSDVVLGDDFEGPLLMSVTPKKESGRTGVLKEWVLVKGHAGTVSKLFTNSASESFRKAIYANGGNFATTSFSSPYSVGIGTKDATAMLVASGIAGVVRAPLTARNTVAKDYGFSLCGDYIATTGTFQGPSTSFSAAGRSASEFATASYTAFEGTYRAKFDANADKYPWGSEAVLVPAKGVADAFGAVAAYAYAMKAPVFFAEPDGSVSAATLRCLADFTGVAVIGDTTAFSDESLARLKASLSNAGPANGIDVRRIAAEGGPRESAGALSVATAKELVSKKAIADPSYAALVDVREPADALAALNMCGPNGGMLFCSSGSADSKQVIAYLKGHNASLDVIRFFGRDSSIMSTDGFDAYDHAGRLWDEAYAAPSVAAGDTFALNGAQVSIGQDGVSLSSTGAMFAQESYLPKGTYVYAGKSYSLGQDIGKAPDPSDGKTGSSKLDLGNMLITDFTAPGLVKDPAKPSTEPTSPNGQQPDLAQSEAPDLTVGSGQPSSPQGRLSIGNVGTTGTSSNTSSGGGSLNLRLDRSENDEALPLAETGEGAEGDLSMAGDPLNGQDVYAAESDAVRSSGGTQMPPMAVAAVILLILSATVAAIWYAARRRPNMEEALS